MLGSCRSSPSHFFIDVVPPRSIRNEEEESQKRKTEKSLVTKREESVSQAISAAKIRVNCKFCGPGGNGNRFRTRNGRYFARKCIRMVAPELVRGKSVGLIFGGVRVCGV
ncbi:AAEL011880-PA [Aedes aegypti]|uniref:AAEL011880-PA n=1 Tax=Aedes aegypti TaxID=7159 RepID=Q16NS7_AEDAE|nr:AAEL011880-PA [Aedes aegypti]